MKFLLLISLFLIAVKAVDPLAVKKEQWTTDVGRKSGAGRIISGSDAAEGQFPWQASVLIDSYSFCGGSLISTTAVLTAAHCVLAGSWYTITVGSLFPRLATEASSQTLNSTDAVYNEGFYTPDGNAAYYDVGVIRWEKPLLVTDTVTPIRLPSRSQQDETFTRWQAVVSGWGITSDDDLDLAPTLQYTEVGIISNEQCRETYGDLVDENAICTLGTDRQQTCYGDSGGPLVVFEADGLPTVVGVVSWGSPLSCETSDPDVFMRVTAFLDWIADNARIQVSAN